MEIPVGHPAHPGRGEEGSWSLEVGTESQNWKSRFESQQQINVSHNRHITFTILFHIGGIIGCYPVEFAGNIREDNSVLQTGPFDPLLEF